MLKINLGDIFRKDYIDHQRHFLALEDSVGLYVHCVDMNTGDTELVKLSLPSSATKIEIIG